MTTTISSGANTSNVSVASTDTRMTAAATAKAMAPTMSTVQLIVSSVCSTSSRKRLRTSPDASSIDWAPGSR